MTYKTTSMSWTRWRPRARRDRQPWIDWMVIPTFVILIVVIGYPIFRAITLAFTDFNLIYGDAAARNVGFDNFARLSGDPVFWRAVRNTFMFAAVSLVGAAGIGLALALATENLQGPWRFLRGFLLAPWAIPVIVTAFLFQFLFLDRGGLINDLLMRTGLTDGPVRWLTSSDWAMWSVIIANVWGSAPFFLLVFTAGLRAVPDEVIEAARVDRTGPWMMTWSIKIPFLLGPAIVASVIATIGNLNQFPLVYSLTGGGPGYSSTTLPIYLYSLAFIRFDLGYASTVGVVWLAFMMIIAAVFLRRLQEGHR
jgi:ABC-type sugar transport system permease subunit